MNQLANYWRQLVFELNHYRLLTPALPQNAPIHGSLYHLPQDFREFHGQAIADDHEAHVAQVLGLR